ncbi:alpha-galactosidase [Streptomyces cocklensis]|uniref:Alpha-galactosidase n=1 Tax=Actinacidiphila cocklensis TaxID=887465 RepID=A0A9W4DNY4_9ACTN|nr:glycoside hydrolase family 36 protein [Actinacidiphila cocklensis]MDD1063202.1 alpha-galactosidase [Actinacidiphila cocklensis]CAG6393628.1 Alpha-galactosidase [Actinacidiphila cocklensis]
MNDTSHGTAGRFSPVARVTCDPEVARVYEHGWQSWSPSGIYPGSGTSPRPTFEKTYLSNWRGDVPPPATGFQGEGLLAVQPEPGAPVTLVASPDPRHEVPSIRVSAVAEGLEITANGHVETRVDNGPNGIPGAIGRWANELVAQLGLAAPKPVGPMWCSWYCYWDQVTDAQVLDDLGRFEPAGLDVRIVQIDDGYQAEIGDWLEPRPGFGDLGVLARRITDTGRHAGLWTAPFLAGHRSRLWRDHEDWFLRGVDAGSGWTQDLAALDLTHPGALEYLDTVFRSFRDMGFSFYKLDFLYAGALPGPHHDADVTPIEAYRQGLRTVRAAVGPDAVLLGCGAPIFPSLGLVDIMRVSPDTASALDHPSGDGSLPSSRNALATGMAREWQHGRFWINDPDCLLVAPKVEQREQWARWIEQSAGLRSSSDSIAELDEWGLRTTRRLLSPSLPSAVPADLL